MTVALDRGWYAPGEQVIIHITTVGDINATWLWLYVDKPDGRNALFMQLEPVNQNVIWNIPIDALEGTYTVTVTWDHRYVQTGFMVEGEPIPEFPVAPVVLVVVLAFAVAALARRKAGARAKAPGAHS